MNDNRIRVQTRLYDAIKSRTDLCEKDLQERSKKIEASIYNYTIRNLRSSKRPHGKLKTFVKKITIQKNNEELCKEYKSPTFKKAAKYKRRADWDCYIFSSRYSNKALSIIKNIKDTRNTGFITAIAEKTVPLREIANLSPEEIFPEYP